jgi:DNA-binding response OmpR family regulator
MEPTSNAKRILLAEDEKDLREAVKAELTSQGYVVIEAENGTEALNLTISEKPDIVLLDIVMPEMDGMTVLKKIRENPEVADMSVIMLTNLGTNDQIMEGIVRDTPAYYLVKSDWKMEDIVNMVREVIANKEKK